MYKNIVDCTYKSYKKDGLGAFFKGYTPALLRAAPVGFVVFPCVYKIRETLNGP